MEGEGLGGVRGVWSLPLVCDACFTVAGHIREEPEKNRRHVCEEQTFQRLRAEKCFKNIVRFTYRMKLGINCNTKKITAIMATS